MPPGGFRYQQLNADGTVLKAWATMNDAWTLAQEIADFRTGNELPRATAKEALTDIENYTCTRLHGDPNWCVDAEAKKKGVRAAITRLSNRVGLAVGGARILVEWLGDGAKPVPIAVAQARANVCLHGGPDGTPCPQNKEGHFFLKLTADSVKAIAEQMQAKSEMKLRVEGEEGLHACAVCACPLPLKVHVPLATILAHTDNETLNAFPAWCWVATERQ